MANTIINVNGRQYDSRTGKMLGKVPDPQIPAPKIHNSKPVNNHAVAKPGAILDGISKPKKFQTSNVTKQTSTAPAKPLGLKSVKNGNNQAVKPAAAKVQKSETLNRVAVKKPINKSPKIHATSSIANSKVEHSATGRGLLIKRIPDSRLARAGQTVKSNIINKFNANPISKPPILDQTLGVTKAPVTNSTSQTATVTRSLNKPKLVSQNKTQQTVFFHPNIENATNHKNPKVPKKKFYTNLIQKFQVKPKLLGAGALVVAILVLGSFFVYQNMPNVALRVANNKAGFQGRMPGTTPAGFAFKGPIKYTKGNISMSFASRSDDRNFVLSQKPSDQTSESLLVSEISPSKKHYQTYHDRGLTVYIFNDGNAAWVDKGVQYNIKDNGALSSEQVLSIAASM